MRVCACNHMNEAALRGRCPAWHSSQVKTDGTFKTVSTTTRYPVVKLDWIDGVTVSLSLSFPQSLSLFPSPCLSSFLILSLYFSRSISLFVFIIIFLYSSISLYWFLVSLNPSFLSSSHLSTGYLEGQAGQAHQVAEEMKNCINTSGNFMLLLSHSHSSPPPSLFALLNTEANNQNSVRSKCVHHHSSHTALDKQIEAIKSYII